MAHKNGQKSAALHGMEEHIEEWKMRITMTDKKHNSKIDYYTDYICENSDLAIKDADLASWLIVNEHPVKRHCLETLTGTKQIKANSIEMPPSYE